MLSRIATYTSAALVAVQVAGQAIAETSTSDSAVSGSGVVAYTVQGATWTKSDYVAITAYDAALFYLLKRQWHKERGATSVSSKIAMCSSYQKIIGMGEAAIPLILHDLAKNLSQPEHWFWALAMITREDPIPVALYGRHVEMAKAWLRWGEERGHYIGGQSRTFLS